MDLLDKVIAKAASIPHKPLSQVTFWFGFIVSLLLAAQITWKLVPTHSSPSAWSPTATTVGSGAGQIDLTGLQQLGLFGKADAQSERPKVEVVEAITDAPKTSLSILLTGVVASTADQKGLAIIESSGIQETYSLGDKIKGTSASLKEVYADRIIITNAGRYETLMLDGLVYTSQSAVNQQLQQAKTSKVEQTVSRVDQRQNAEISQELAESRNELLADPSKITDYIAISPVRQGDAVVGYRLNPGKDVNLFRQAGFKANDLAKSINGYDLTVMTQALEMMSQLPELTEVSIMVEREGQLVEIMFSLPQ
ncbi:type II secretion system protein GspC [Shewanella putrefaciens]|jgi:general secretion pathway protein C|uniref:General secretion pathway protein C n=1 Tax=Shewanella putrefaciens (strain 200) TaxID=399804 RepID=E6XGB1_SHEP2|nr:MULTISPECIES: type II secretion system protein GspC [Shewanella]ABM26514.1 general secretion pathway protein C [Shewanella sp. W3-18-1]MDR6965894.1 general secretion pathway protein C [Shewanella putrefaciens]UXK08903.1 type II secretion system protein GspC [Shewanella putrefaciens]